ncbi:MAG: hypothetical protein FJ304_12635 [Planctomycetes bacterium]|nr:hypothetical protein [Planctomycetota bacterium]
MAARPICVSRGVHLGKIGPHLAELKNLRDLQIAYCDSSDEQRKQLAAALPKCRIEWDGGEIKPTK